MVKLYCQFPTKEVFEVIIDIAEDYIVRGSIEYNELEEYIKTMSYGSRQFLLHELERNNDAYYEGLV